MQKTKEMHQKVPLMAPRASPGHVSVALGSLLEAFRALLDAVGALWGALGALLGRSWTPLGRNIEKSWVCALSFGPNLDSKMEPSWNQNR